MVWFWAQLRHVRGCAIILDGVSAVFQQNISSPRAFLPFIYTFQFAKRLHFTNAFMSTNISKGGLYEILQTPAVLAWLRRPRGHLVRRRSYGKREGNRCR